jgi:hypothetical protein
VVVVVALVPVAEADVVGDDVVAGDDDFDELEQAAATMTIAATAMNGRDLTG